METEASVEQSPKNSYFSMQKRSKELFCFSKKIVVALFLFFLVTMHVSAQPGDPGGNPDAVPISGIEYLLAAGALLGFRMLRANRK